MPETRLERVVAAVGMAAIAGLVALIVPAWLRYQDAVAAGGRARPQPPATVAVAAPRATVTTAKVARPGPTIAVNAVRGDAWLEVHASSANGKVLFQGLLSKGKTVSFAAASVWARVGAGANVDITFAGKPLAIPAGTANLLITAAGARPLGG
jgi:RodZ C-terminal domain